MPSLWAGFPLGKSPLLRLGLGAGAGVLFYLSGLFSPAPVCSCAVDGSQSYQPRFDEATSAFYQAGANNLSSSYPALPYIETGYPNTSLVPATVPCVLLESLGYIESGWRQAVSTARGSTGPTLVSSGCAYGVMQIASGMSVPGALPEDTQRRIAEDYRYNIAWGTKMLIDKWNVGDYWDPAAVVGNRNPAVVEDWYYAVWAYNYWGWRNNPNNPDFPWPRAPYDGSQSYTGYPYQELVWGRAANPPYGDGQPLWTSAPLTLPNRDAVGLTPGPLSTPQIGRAS